MCTPLGAFAPHYPSQCASKTEDCVCIEVAKVTDHSNPEGNGHILYLDSHQYSVLRNKKGSGLPAA